MYIQKTKFNSLFNSIINYLSTSLVGPWRRRSIGLISLLSGYYIGSNLTVYFLQRVGLRPIVVIFMVFILEVLVRLRTNVKQSPWPLHWLAIDNMRIGSVYSVVLEAFKLGS